MSLPWVQKEAMEVFSDPAPGREYLITRQYFADPFGWYTISRSSGETRLFQPFGTGPLPQTFIRDRARKLSTMSTGFGNQWNLYIDFADDPNRLYVCLLGSTGIRPGIPLADGRVIRLNVDALTWLGFSGQIPGLSGLVGRLDDRGTALGLLDLTWLPPGVSGIPFWLAGFTLDAAAPSGIRSVSDPIVIQLR